MLVELGQMSVRRARAGLQALEAVAEVRWQRQVQGPRGGMADAASEALWQSQGCGQA